jgi:ribosomal protein S27AE
MRSRSIVHGSDFWGVSSIPRTGQKPLKDTYQCTKCPTTVTLDDHTDTLPPCSKCYSTDFMRIGWTFHVVGDICGRMKLALFSRCIKRVNTYGEELNKEGDKWQKALVTREQRMLLQEGQAVRRLPSAAAKRAPAACGYGSRGFIANI